MTKTVKCFVEIYIVKRQVMIIDFGDLAIVVIKDEDGDKLEIFSGDDYADKFKGFWSWEVGKLYSEIEVDTHTFEKIRAAFRHYKRTPKSTLWYLLQKNFQEYLKLYKS